MLPRHNWLAVKREERRTASPLWTPPGVEGLSLECCVGTVAAVGDGRTLKHGHVSHETKPGERVLYSSRVDQYRIDGSDMDVIDDQSLIGWLA